ncbi:MAG: hypothetical protein K0S70_5193, partial [Microbacterium sp.]|nr:hypothetical protein [Microbacterium sp.]
MARATSRDAGTSVVRGWSLASGLSGAVGVMIVVVAALWGTVPWSSAVIALGAVTAHAAIVLAALPRV